jgi:hypothetical protein
LFPDGNGRVMLSIADIMYQKYSCRKIKFDTLSEQDEKFSEIVAKCYLSVQKNDVHLATIYSKLKPNENITIDYNLEYSLDGQNEMSLLMKCFKIIANLDSSESDNFVELAEFLKSYTENIQD